MAESGRGGPVLGQGPGRHDTRTVGQSLNEREAEHGCGIALPEEQAKAEIDQWIAQRCHFPIKDDPEFGPVGGDEAVVEMEIAVDHAGAVHPGLMGEEPCADLLKERQIAHPVSRPDLEPAFDLPLDEAIRARKIGGEHLAPIDGVDARQPFHHGQAKLVHGLVGVGPVGREALGKRNALNPFGDGKSLADHGRISTPCNGFGDRSAAGERGDHAVFALDPGSGAVGNDIDRRVAQHEPTFAGLDQTGDVGIAAGEDLAEDNVAATRRLRQPSLQAPFGIYRLHIRPPSVNTTDPVM